jgi:PKD repeat protein
LSAVIKADKESGEAPLEVKFDASKSIDPDGTIKRYEWDLDEDGEFDDEEGEEITYEFEKLGRYTVALRITSSTGDYAIGEMEIVVEETNLPEAVITIVDEPAIFISGQSYAFKADESTSKNGDIEKYEWNFGDGTTSKTKSASHAFSKNGTYEITLKVTDEKEKEGEATKTITVGAPKATPKAFIKTEPIIEEGALSLKGEAPFTVIFDASNSTDSDNNIVDYGWDFDSDETVDEYGKTVTHTYNEEGTYTVKLYVTDSDENVGTATVPVEVEAVGITAIMKADKIEGNVPLTVAFDASGSTFDKGQITSYQWDFGDGTAPKLGTSSISHKYTSIGIFTASVTAIGSDNSTATATILITVREIPLTSCFSSVFAEGTAPFETSFDPSCSTGTISGYLWDFGDGTTSTLVKPTHIFTTPGEYTVILEVSDAENTVDQSETLITVTE